MPKVVIEYVATGEPSPAVSLDALLAATQAVDCKAFGLNCTQCPMYKGNAECEFMDIIRFRQPSEDGYRHGERKPAAVVKSVYRIE